MFEFFHKAIEEHQKFLLKIVQNRKTDEASKIFDKVKSEEAACEIVVDIPRDIRRNLPKRETALEINYSELNILTP